MTAAPIALTCGEPAGIAPEITGKAWTELRADAGNRFFPHRRRGLLAGARGGVHRQADCHGLTRPLRRFRPSTAGFAPAVARKSRAGTLEPANAACVIASIEEAASLVLGGDASAIVTNPIQKETLYAAGFRHQGHTDYLAHLAERHGHAARAVMMLVAQDLRAVPLTVHIPLADVPGALTHETIIGQARVVDRDLKKYLRNCQSPLGLYRAQSACRRKRHNGARGARCDHRPRWPHSRREGLRISGPLSADTAFHAEARAQYDAILCMYHDQALIPVKTLDFHGGVNVTLGLPFVRTSPDHGTALNIAGTGTANRTSLIGAIRLAALMAQNAGA